MAQDQDIRDGVEPEVPRELSDEQLEQVAGGSRSGNTCPECGSTDWAWRGEARAYVCGNCLYIE